jgi:hypothetical protein
MRIAIMGSPGGQEQEQRVAARAPKILRVKVEALGGICHLRPERVASLQLG